jgi:hypothetical protein
MSEAKTLTCYRPTEAEDGLAVASLGRYAEQEVTSKDEALLRKAVNAYYLEIRYTVGLDANSDNGIQSVSTSKETITFAPADCILKEGKVIGFVYDGKPFLIGNDRYNSSHNINLTSRGTGPYGEDEVDETNFYLKKR